MSAPGVGGDGTMPVGAVIAAVLADAGVTHVFGVPGESQLGLIDAVHGHDSLTFVATRHEEGAGYMADAAARVTGRPGVAVAGRGPGVAHLAIALHTAYADNVPLVAVVGQVSGAVRHRNAFQEMDLVAFARPVTKHALQIDDASRVGELVRAAVGIATTGRPGPVLIALPDEVDRGRTAPAAPLAAVSPPQPDPAGLAAAASLLAAAESPVLIIGEAAVADDPSPLTGLAEVLAAGVYAGWRHFDVFPNDHPSYLGNLPWLADDLYEPLDRADVVVLIGSRLDEFTSRRYRFPTRDHKVVAVDVDPGVLASIPAPEMTICGDPLITAAALREALGSHRPAPHRRDRLAGERAAFVAASTPRSLARSDGYVDLEGAFASMRQLVPADAITTSDAGAFGSWISRFYWWRRPRTFLGPMAGSMGYAVPAAVAARLASGRPTLAFAGDGGFAMTMSEVATAVKLGLGSLVFIVFNNSSYGIIERHQRSEYPASAAASKLGTVDFAAVGRGLGAEGHRVGDNAGFAAALESALAADHPVVLDVAMDPEVFSAWAGYGEPDGR